MKKCTECEEEFYYSNMMVAHLLTHLTEPDVESVLKFIFNMLN